MNFMHRWVIRLGALDLAKGFKCYSRRKCIVHFLNILKKDLPQLLLEKVFCFLNTYGRTM